jgi:hypothetical protein
MVDPLNFHHEKYAEHDGASITTAMRSAKQKGKRILQSNDCQTMLCESAIVGNQLAGTNAHSGHQDELLSPH